MHREKPRPTEPDCGRCPKDKLYPGHHGLHPANRLAVEMYRLASRDQRGGESAVLLSTMSPADAWAVIEGYGPLHFPSRIEKTQIFELMSLIDDVATKVRGDDEHAQREAARAKAGKR